jgi:hypothetical protein
LNVTINALRGDVVWSDRRPHRSGMTALRVAWRARHVAGPWRDGGMRMPLSEDDRRRLDEIEHALTRDDPQFAARVNVQWRRRRRLLGALTCFIVGAVLLIAGLVTTHAVIVIGVIIAVAGLGAMVAAAGVLLYGPRRRRP